MFPSHGSVLKTEQGMRQRGLRRRLPAEVPHGTSQLADRDSQSLARFPSGHRGRTEGQKATSSCQVGGRGTRVTGCLQAHGRDQSRLSLVSWGTLVSQVMD